MLTPATRASMLVAIPTARRVGSVRLVTWGMCSSSSRWFQPSLMTLIPRKVNTAKPSQWSQAAMYWWTETQHGHQELSRPGGHGKLDAVDQTFLLNEQAVGERHDKGVYGQGESQE